MFGCDNDSYSHVPLFDFPSNSTVSRKWDKAVCEGRKNWCVGQGTTKHQICALHFKDEDFASLFKWERGFGKLLLNRGTVPSVASKNITLARRQQLTKLNNTPNEGAPVTGFAYTG